MMRKALLLATAVALTTLASCGGGGGGGSADTSSNLTSPSTTESTESTNRTVNGVVEASIVANAKVCLSNSELGFNYCTTTNENGEFTAQIPVELNQVNVSVETASGVKIGEATVVIPEDGNLVITPTVLADGSQTLGKVLKAVIHLFGGDPELAKNQITLSDLEVVDENGQPISNIEEAVKQGKKLKVSLGNLTCTINPLSFSLSCEGNSSLSVDLSGVELNYEEESQIVKPEITKVEVPVAPSTTKKWTIAVYMGADNDLEPFADADVEEIKQALSTLPENIEVVILYDGSTKEDGIYYSEDGRLKFWPVGGEFSTGNPETLRSFLKTVKEKFPAENYALIFWGHGDGWRSSPLHIPADSRFVAFDYDGGIDAQTALATWELVKELKNSGMHFGVVGFDACLMGMAEVIYPVLKYGNADWVVASELPEPGRGWNYADWLSHINDTTTAEEMAKTIVDSFKETYGSTTGMDFTLGAFSKTGMENLIKAVNTGIEWVFDQYYYKLENWSWRANALDLKTGAGEKDLPALGYADMIGIAKALANADNQLRKAVDWANNVINTYNQEVEAGNIYVAVIGSHDWSGISALFPREEDATNNALYYGNGYDYFASCNPETFVEQATVTYSDGHEELTDFPNNFCNPFRTTYYWDDSYGVYTRDSDWTDLVAVYSSAVDNSQEPVVIVGTVSQ